MGVKQVPGKLDSPCSFTWHACCARWRYLTFWERWDPIYRHFLLTNADIFLVTSLPYFSVILQDIYGVRFTLTSSQLFPCPVEWRCFIRVHECSIYALNIPLAVMITTYFPQRTIFQVTILLKVDVTVQPGVLVYAHRLWLREYYLSCESML